MPLLALLVGGGADMPGHGGPIRAVAAVGGHVASASFDGTAIEWPEGVVLRGHDGPVNAVAILTDGRVATGGADGRIVVSDGKGVSRELLGHTAPVAALAAFGSRLASASWDGTARIWALDGSSLLLEGHQGPVNALAWAPDGTSWGHLVTAGYDGTLRLWTGENARIIEIGPPQNAVAVAPDGEIAAGGADGLLRLIGAGGAERSLEIDTTAVTGLSLSKDGSRIAVVSLGGTALVVDRATLHITTVFLSVEHPLWAVAWEGETVVTGGAGRVLRRWNAANGQPLGTLGASPPAEMVQAGGQGAQVFRACSACHALGADDGHHAGPSLHGIFGRRIGSLPGYNYSQALGDMDLVWTPETVSLLFEHGPQALTPGTKMPEQRIVDPADRAALMRFLVEATK